MRRPAVIRAVNLGRWPADPRSAVAVGSDALPLLCDLQAGGGGTIKQLLDAIRAARAGSNIGSGA